MSRSIWKGPFTDSFLIKKVSFKKKDKQSSKNTKPIKTWSRRSMILPEFVGLHFQVYNGKTFIRMLVTDDMIGHKFGEFVSTRKKCIHDK